MWPESNYSMPGAFGGQTPWGSNLSGISAFGGPSGPSMQSNPLGLTLQDTPRLQMDYGSQPLGMPNAPTASGGGWQGAKDWFSNGQNLGVAIQGFGSLAQAYLGFQAMKQAKEGLKFQKEAFNANLGNSIKSYNTGLEDRINGRTSAHDGKEQEVAAYLAKHSLKR